MDELEHINFYDYQNQRLLDINFS